MQVASRERFCRGLPCGKHLIPGALHGTTGGRSRSATEEPATAHQASPAATAVKVNCNNVPLLLIEK